ncbi:MAG: hypothetical protein J1E41_05375, partial [Ruminococcus sp.]|nr:hypothetical protein [Ruminococcus sp.]
MKKTIAIILSALLLISCISIAAASAATGTKVVLNGTIYECGVGDTLTYTINMTTPEKIENGQFIIYYPNSVLSVGGIKFNDILGSPIYNYTENVTDEIDFNFSHQNGFDFTTKQLLCEVTFNVTAAGAGGIDLSRLSADMVICNMNDVNIASSVVFEEILSGATVVTDPETSETPGDTQPTTPSTENPNPTDPKPTDPKPTTPSSGGTTTSTSSVKPAKNLGPGANAEAVDAAIKAFKNDNDPKGSDFGLLKAKATKVTKNSIKV